MFHIYIYVVQEYSKLHAFQRVKGRASMPQINAHKECLGKGDGIRKIDLVF